MDEPENTNLGFPSYGSVWPPWKGINIVPYIQLGGLDNIDINASESEIGHVNNNTGLVP